MLRRRPGQWKPAKGDFSDILATIKNFNSHTDKGVTHSRRYFSVKLSTELTRQNIFVFYSKPNVRQVGMYDFSCDQTHSKTKRESEWDSETSTLVRGTCKSHQSCF